MTLGHQIDISVIVRENVKLPLGAVVCADFFGEITKFVTIVVCSLCNRERFRQAISRSYFSR